MKRFMDQIPGVVSAALAFLIFARIPPLLLGYRLVWLGGNAVFLSLAILFIIGAIWLRTHAHWRHFTLSQTNLHCTLAILPLSVMTYFFHTGIPVGRVSFLLPLACLLLITTAIGLLLRTGHVAAGLGSLVATCLVVTICFVSMFVSLFNTRSATPRVPSPDGAYTAQVIFAEDSYIAITECRSLHLGIFTLEPVPKKIHIDTANRDLSWEDETTVRVGDTLYTVR